MNAELGVNKKGVQKHSFLLYIKKIHDIIYKDEVRIYPKWMRDSSQNNLPAEVVMDKENLYVEYGMLNYVLDVVSIINETVNNAHI